MSWTLSRWNRFCWRGRDGALCRMPIAQHMRGAVVLARQGLIEMLADHDELAQWIEDPHALTPDAIRAGIRRVCVAGRCTRAVWSGDRNIGVQPLDAIVDYVLAGGSAARHGHRSAQWNGTIPCHMRGCACGCADLEGAAEPGSAHSLSRVYSEGRPAPPGVVAGSIERHAARGCVHAR